VGVRASERRASLSMTAVPVMAVGSMPVAGAAPMSAGVRASVPPVAWVVLWAVGVRASVRRASSPAATVPVVVPTGRRAMSRVPEVMSEVAWVWLVGVRASLRGGSRRYRLWR
jgi:hypothetical protein